jgi:endonuclease YncB( thermonuclease family)
MKLNVWGSASFSTRLNLKAAALAVLAAQMGVASFTSTTAWALTVSGTVTKVSDGDTIHVRAAGESKPLKVRMVGIDTPELHFPAAGGWQSQGHWAEEAQKRLSSLIPLASRVTLETYGTDKYGRTLARVFRNSRDINLTLVEEGLALPYVICDGRECDETFMQRHDVQRYLEACDNAERKELGMFDSQNPLKEMPFEFRLRLQKRTPDKFPADFHSKTYREPSEYSKVPRCSRIFFLKETEAKKLGFNRS